VATVALAEAEDRDGQDRQPDRQVDPEDPVPADRLHDPAADDRSERAAQSGDPAPDADRPAVPLGWERLEHERQRQRHHHGRAQPLQRAGRDQHVDRRRGAGEQ
jgi:hypothetical protein